MNKERFEVVYHIAAIGGFPNYYFDHEKNKLFTLNGDMDITEDNVLIENEKLKDWKGNFAFTKNCYSTIEGAKEAAMKMEKFDQFVNEKDKGVPEAVVKEYYEKRALVESVFYELIKNKGDD